MFVCVLPVVNFLQCVCVCVCVLPVVNFLQELKLTLVEATGLLKKDAFGLR